MKWFKFYGQDYLSDPKILTLSASERSCLITLLAYGSVNDNGLITFLSEEQLLAQAGIDPKSSEWNKTKGVLEKLKSLKIIDFDNGVITIVNWQKRQETNLTGYERVKRYREKKRNDNVDDNAKITSDKNRIDKIREDKREKKEKPERHISFLINLPQEVIAEFTKTFSVYEKGLKEKADDLYNYCKAKGKTYKDYKAFLRNAVKKDFGIRPPEDIELQERIRATRERSNAVSPYAKKLSDKMKMK